MRRIPSRRRRLYNGGYRWIYALKPSPRSAQANQDDASTVIGTRPCAAGLFSPGSLPSAGREQPSTCDPKSPERSSPCEATGEGDARRWSVHLHRFTPP